MRAPMAWSTSCSARSRSGVSAAANRVVKSECPRLVTAPPTHAPQAAASSSWWASKASMLAAYRLTPAVAMPLCGVGSDQGGLDAGCGGGSREDLPPFLVGGGASLPGGDFTGSQGLLAGAVVEVLHGVKLGHRSSARGHREGQALLDEGKAESHDVGHDALDVLADLQQGSGDGGISCPGEFAQRFDGLGYWFHFDLLQVGAWRSRPGPPARLVRSPGGQDVPIARNLHAGPMAAGRGGDRRAIGLTRIPPWPCHQPRPRPRPHHGQEVVLLFVSVHHDPPPFVDDRGQVGDPLVVIDLDTVRGHLPLELRRDIQFGVLRVDGPDCVHRSLDGQTQPFLELGHPLGLPSRGNP